MIELKPIIDRPSDWDEIEKRIKEAFKQLIYYPLMRELKIPQSKLKNAMADEALLEAIRMGKIQFSSGTFTGRFNAKTSKELRRIGAKWDRKTGTWRIQKTDLPMDVRQAVSLSESVFIAKLEKLDEHLAKVLPEQVADKIKIEDLFDTAIFKVEKDIQKNIENITVAPKLSDEARKRLAAEWQDNMDIWIKDFSAKNISKLRSDIRESFLAGNRYESLIGKIQTSYGVSANKAKFLARQETNLLMSKFEEVRYAEVGIREYKWRAVAGTVNHPTRHRHRELSQMSDKGHIFRWDDPPITTEPGQAPRRNNPGQDYNCRCFAIPIVRFKPAKTAE